MTNDNRRAVLEALLFASSRPLSVDNLSESSGIDKKEIREILAALKEEYSSQHRGFSLEEVAGGFQLRSDPRYSAQIGKLFAARSRRRMTRSSLESLAIIAYRQPATRAEVEHIRGVDSGAVLKTLLALSMIRILGRKEAPGRPILYGTTREFLEYFGLRDIESLPTLEEVTELLEVADNEESGVRSQESEGVSPVEYSRTSDADENIEKDHVNEETSGSISIQDNNKQEGEDGESD